MLPLFRFLFPKKYLRLAAHGCECQANRHPLRIKISAQAILVMSYNANAYMTCNIPKIACFNLNAEVQHINHIVQAIFDILINSGVFNTKGGGHAKANSVCNRIFSKGIEQNT